MGNIKIYLYQSPRPLHYFGGLVVMALVAMATMICTSSGPQDFSQAASPTFSLTASSSPTAGQSGTLTLAIDGTNEGAGLLGAETHIPYNTSLIEVTSVNFGSCIFDSCINLSTDGTLKLLAASALPANGGKVVTTKTNFVTVNVNFLGGGTPNLSFSKCQVITDDQVVEDR
ncbi:MAG: hypothetical protein V1760_00005, partial [Candidatus Peregrinibacteria bacterium]